MSGAGSQASLQEVSAVSVAKNAASADPAATASDTVTIGNEAQVNRVRQQKQDPDMRTSADSGGSRQRTVDNILFSYNTRGNLRIKFMDSSSEVVYQTPPEQFSRMTDIILSSRSAVNARI